MAGSKYPRMLFKGDETCVVADVDAQGVKVAQGWQTKPLPGEPGYGEPAAAVRPTLSVDTLTEPVAQVVAEAAGDEPAEPAPVARKKPGPKPKPRP